MDKCSNCCNLRHLPLAWSLLPRLRRRPQYQYLISMLHNNASGAINSLITTRLVKNFMTLFVVVTYISARPIASSANEQMNTGNGQWIDHRYLVRFSLQNCVFIPHTIISTVTRRRVSSCYCFACKNRKHTRTSAIALHIKIESSWRRIMSCYCFVCKNRKHS